MALGSALVDRARLVVSAPTGRRVEGASEFSLETGEWFKARFTLPYADMSRSGGREKDVAPTLMCGVRDVTGVAIEGLSSEAFVEVLSPQTLGPDPVRYTVDGDPQPIRKKRRVIGYEVRLRSAVVSPSARVV